MSDKLLDTANAIYMHFFGHLDDKAFFASKTQEIYDWLTEGEPSDDLKALIREWGDYDADDIKANPSPIRAAAVALGKLGGSKTSERKAISSAVNGKKGGRPKLD